MSKIDHTKNVENYYYELIKSKREKVLMIRINQYEPPVEF